MRKGSALIIIVIVILALIAAVVGFLILNRNNKTVAPSNQPNQEQSQPSQTQPKVQTNEQSQSIAIANFAYSPSNLTVKKGTEVTWTNNDNAIHTVTADNGSFNSGNLSKNQTFRFSFGSTGSFAYHCTPHPFMKGTVTVTE